MGFLLRVLLYQRVSDAVFAKSLAQWSLTLLSPFGLRVEYDPTNFSGIHLRLADHFHLDTAPGWKLIISEVLIELRSHPRIPVWVGVVPGFCPFL